MFAAENLEKLESLDEFDPFLWYVEKMPRQIEEIIELLKLGVKEGIVYSGESLAGTEEQYRVLKLDDVEESPFFKEFLRVSQQSDSNVTEASILRERIKASSNRCLLFVCLNRLHCAFEVITLGILKVQKPTCR